LHAELTGPLDHQIFKLAISDTAGWMRTLTSPWSFTPPALGQFGTLVRQFTKVPSLVLAAASPPK